jgi:hypothetical protein
MYRFGMTPFCFAYRDALFFPSARAVFTDENGVICFGCVDTMYLM